MMKTIGITLKLHVKNLVSYKIRDSKNQYLLYNSLFQNNVAVGRTKETWNDINSLLSKSKNATIVFSKKFARWNRNYCF